MAIRKVGVLEISQTLGPVWRSACDYDIFVDPELPLSLHVLVGAAARVPSRHPPPLPPP